MTLPQAAAPNVLRRTATDAEIHPDQPVVGSAHEFLVIVWPVDTVPADREPARWPHVVDAQIAGRRGRIGEVRRVLGRRPAVCEVGAALPQRGGLRTTAARGRVGTYARVLEQLRDCAGLGVRPRGEVARELVLGITRETRIVKWRPG
jgi:hypothetical protein